MKKSTASGLMFIVTVIWGGGFVATKLALDAGIPRGMLNMLRGAIFATLTFAAFPKKILGMTKEILTAGFLVGVFNRGGFVLQAIGAMYTTPSNSAFLTTSNVVIVPIWAWVIYKIKPTFRNIAAIAVCMTGMGVLSGVFNSRVTVNIGDVYTVAGAIVYAVAIVLLSKQPADSHFSQSAFLMGVTMFLGGLICFILFDDKTVLATIDVKSAILPVLYLSAGSNFIANSLQIVSQKHLPATTASLIMMLEGVFGSIFSIMWGFEKFTLGLVTGGGLILLSLVISEINFKKKT